MVDIALAALTLIAFKALIGAVLWAVVGILSKKPEEAFDPDKLFSTLFAAVVVAILEVAWGIDPGTGENIFYYLFLKTSITGTLDKILKALWRNKVRDWWLNFVGDGQ